MAGSRHMPPVANQARRVAAARTTLTVKVWCCAARIACAVF